MRSLRIALSHKTYLMILFSTSCIFLYQYHLYKGNLMPQQDVVRIYVNDLPKIGSTISQKPVRNQI